MSATHFFMIYSFVSPTRQFVAYAVRVVLLNWKFDSGNRNSFFVMQITASPIAGVYGLANWHDNWQGERAENPCGTRLFGVFERRKTDTLTDKNRNLCNEVLSCQQKKGSSEAGWTLKNPWKTKKKALPNQKCFFGADTRIWTGDLILTKESKRHRVSSRIKW